MSVIITSVQQEMTLKLSVINMNLYFGRQKSEIWMKLCFNNISLNSTDEKMTVQKII